MATQQTRPTDRRDPGKQLGDRDAAAAGADAGRGPGGPGSAGGAAAAPQPTLIDGQLPLTEPRCGGRLPGKGTGMCGLNLTCARWTQLAKDRASGRTDWVGVPVWWTCARSKVLMVLDGYVRDPAAQPPAPKPPRRTKPKRRTALDIAEEKIRAREFHRSKRR